MCGPGFDGSGGKIKTDMVAGQITKVHHFDQVNDLHQEGMSSGRFLPAACPFLVRR